MRDFWIGAIALLMPSLIVAALLCRGSGWIDVDD